MASSSSSHLILSRSSFKSWKYAVYVSFRGEDTRNIFVDHLYTSLSQQGIHTYKDDGTITLGESIGPSSLLKAIRESRIAVIVFSENYADSSWCLDELAYIMECMTTRGQIFMPVFYHVDPSDVRKQKGKYGEAFAKHELKNKQKVELWKNALAAAGDLFGGWDDGKLYIFLELVTKGSLAKLYKEYELQDSQVSAYTRQILSGLNYLHERDVVHRDIKCANILVDASGSMKLADTSIDKSDVLLKY